MNSRNTTMKFTNKLMLGIGTLGLLAGIGGTAALQTFAADGTTTGATATTATSGNVVTQAAEKIDRALGGHVGANGTKEELLTGDTAAKVTAAALAAEPGATIDRVETDAEGAAYEAHITKADGTRATLKFDTSFTVTATEAGGPGGHGGR